MAIVMGFCKLPNLGHDLINSHGTQKLEEEEVEELRRSASHAGGLRERDPFPQFKAFAIASPFGYFSEFSLSY